MYYTLTITPGAEADLRALHASDPEAAALVFVVLEEFEASDEAMDTLTLHEFFDTLPESKIRYGVEHWWTQYRSNKNLWRLRIFDSDALLKNYRVVYAYTPLESRYYVLGVVPRSFNYDPSHHLSQRMLRDYENYCT